MIRTIKKYLLVAATAATMLIPTIGVPAVVAAGGQAGAGCTGINNPLSEGANTAITNNGTNGGDVNCNSTGVSSNSVKALAAKIVNIFSIVVGAASVIMIIYGGFRYVISGGESNRVGAAKNSLIYAIVGLVIVAIAQLIVHFVLNQSTQLNNGVSVLTIHSLL